MPEIKLASLVAQLKLDSREFRRGMDQSQSTTKRWGSAVKVAAVAGAVALAKFGVDSVHAFQEAERAQLELSQAFEKFPKLADTSQAALEKLNQELQRKTRFDDEAAASAEALLAQFDLTGSQIEELIPLVADFAAKTGQELPAAAENLGRAFLGNTRALKALGIDFKATGDRGKDFESIVGHLQAKVGGFAEKEGKTLSGQLAIMGNQFGEIQEKIGAALVPALTDLAGHLLSVIEFVQRNSAVIIPLVKVVGGFATAVFLINKAQKSWLAIQSALNFLLGRSAGAIAANAAATTAATAGAQAHAAALALQAGAASRMSVAFLGIAKAAAPVGLAIFGATQLIKSQQVAVDNLIAKVEQGTAVFEDFSGVNSVLLNKSLNVSVKNLEKFALSADGLRFIGEEASKTAAHLLKLGAQVKNPATKADLLNKAWQVLRQSFDEGKRAADRAALAAERTGTATGKAGDQAGDAAAGFEDLKQSLQDYNAELERTLGVTLDAEEAADDLTKAKKDLAAQLKENGPIFDGNSDAALENRDALRQVIEKAEAYADALILSGQASVESKPDILIASLKTLAKKYPELKTLIQGYINKVKAADDLAITNPVKQPGMAAALTNLDKLKEKLGDVGSLGITYYTNLAGKASGGPVFARRPYIVGEEGPELFIPKVSGTIIPNNQLTSSAAAASVTNSETSTRVVNNHFTINNPRGETTEDTMHRQLRNLTYLGVL